MEDVEEKYDDDAFRRARDHTKLNSLVTGKIMNTCKKCGVNWRNRYKRSICFNCMYSPDVWSRKCKNFDTCDRFVEVKIVLYGKRKCLGCKAKKLRESIQRKKEELMKTHGGVCRRCQDDDTDHGVFHHVDPLAKEFGCLWVRSKKIIDEEMPKIVLVCQYCHKDIHANRQHEWIIQQKEYINWFGDRKPTTKGLVRKKRKLINDEKRKRRKINKKEQELKKKQSTMRTCKKCERNKALTDFYFRAGGKYRDYSLCKECCILHNAKKKRVRLKQLTEPGETPCCAKCKIQVVPVELENYVFSATEDVQVFRRQYGLFQECFSFSYIERTCTTKMRSTGGLSNAKFEQEKHKLQILCVNCFEEQRHKY
jgi:hypothetical protein